MLFLTFMTIQGCGGGRSSRDNTTPNNGVVFYVDPAGSNETGDGSLSKPWKTLNYACQQVKPELRSTIHLNAGKFIENEGCPLPAGVNLEGAGMGRTILQGSCNEFLIQLESDFKVNGDQTISGFTIDGQGRKLYGGISVNRRNNVTIRDIAFNGTDVTGLQIHAGGTPDSTIPPREYLTGIKVYQCHFTNCSKDFANDENDIGWGKGWSSGALQIGQLDGAEIHDITINENRGGGIKFCGNGWLKNLELYQCNIRVPDRDPFWGADFAIELWNIYDNCKVYRNTVNNWVSFVRGNKGNGTHSLQFFENRIVFPDTGNPQVAIEASASDMEISNNYIEKAGLGVSLWYDKSQANVLVHHNVFYDFYHPSDYTAGLEIHLNKGTVLSNIRVFHNVFHNIRPDNQHPGLVIGAKVLFEGVLNGLQIKNNIFMNTGTKTIKQDVVYWDGKGEIRNADISYNCLDNVQLGNAGPFAHNLFANPGITASGSRPFPYYRLNGNSGLIDKGIPVGFPYSGNAPDIGADEN